MALQMLTFTLFQCKEGGPAVHGLTPEEHRRGFRSLQLTERVVLEQTATWLTTGTVDWIQCTSPSPWMKPCSWQRITWQQSLIRVSNFFLSLSLSLSFCLSPEAEDESKRFVPWYSSNRFGCEPHIQRPHHVYAPLWRQVRDARAHTQTNKQTI